METESEDIGRVRVIRVLTPEATLRNGTDAFRQFFLSEIQNGSRRVVVDLTQVRYADSSFVGALIMGFKSLAATGGDMVVCGANAYLQETFHLTGVDILFRQYNVLPEGVASLY